MISRHTENISAPASTAFLNYIILYYNILHYIIQISGVYILQLALYQ